MSGPYRPFDPAELRVPGEADPSPAESADALSTARELEVLAVSAGIGPTDGFADRVMAAVALEPVPRVVVRPRGAVRGGVLGAFALAFRDAWGVASTGGRPFAVRAQALALVLIVVLAAGSLATAGVVTVGSLLDRHSGPTPSLRPGPTIAPSSTEISEPSETAEPTETSEPSETAEPTETAGPTGTDHHGGGGSGGGAGGGSTAVPTRTAQPIATDDHGGGGGGSGGSGSGKTAQPTQTPRPTETPRGTDGDGGSGGGGGGVDGGSGGSGSD